VLQGVAGALKLGSRGVQRLHACGGEAARLLLVLARIKRHQIADLGQREPCALREADEAQLADVLRAVAPDAAPRATELRLFEESAALAETHRPATDAAFPSRPRDRHCRHRMTLAGLASKCPRPCSAPLTAVPSRLTVGRVEGRRRFYINPTQGD